MTSASAPMARCPTLQIDAHLAIRLLAWTVGPSGDEAYQVSFRRSPADGFTRGVLTHVRGDAWDLREPEVGDSVQVAWASPDQVFVLALGGESPADASTVSGAAPHWPRPIVERLSRRRLAGPGTVAFDAAWFLGELATSAFDHPVLLVDGASKLGLVGLERAAAVLDAVIGAPEGGAAIGLTEFHGSPAALGELLLRALEGEPADGLWGGEGRLIGEFDGGELAQLGMDLEDGCHAALGTGPLEVVFAPRVPLGLGLGPLVRTSVDGVGSEGTGCAVGEVDPGGAAERAGVKPGMPLSHLSDPFLDLSSSGPDVLSFEAVLDAIDSRRALGGPLTLTFDTAASVTHLYAVEMPAAEVLGALAATVQLPWAASRDVGVGASLDTLCGPTLLWREGTPRLFLGEPGSVTSAHSDMCPQVQMAHALAGIKILGVASHPATPRLRAEHAPAGEDDESQATTVPTDRPLSAGASELLCDPDVTLAVLLPGDIAVFDSGALHFASNGAESVSGAVYHGLITPGAVARLRLAAAAHVASRVPPGDAYGDHLFAPELLRLVEDVRSRLQGVLDSLDPS